MQIEEKEKETISIEQETALKIKHETQRLEALRLQREKEYQMSLEENQDDWQINPAQIEMIKSQQFLTMNTITLVREAIGSKRNREDEIPQVSLEERNITVFTPSSAPFDPRSIDIPEDFYVITKQDLQLNAAIQKQKKKEQEIIDGSLRTKEMRERDRIKKLSKYKKCFIRIRFPDRVELQGTFLPLEKISSIYQFVRDCLREESQDFHLYIIPPKTILKTDDPTNLRDHNFLPACLIYFGLNEGSKIQSPFLKEHLIADIKEKLPPPEIYMPPQEQSPIIIANPLTEPVRVKKEKPDYYEEKPTEKDEEQKNSVPIWFKKGKK